MRHFYVYKAEIGGGVSAGVLAGVSADRKLAASVAIGLLNRARGKPTALALNSPTDWKWVAGIRSGAELSGSCWVAASDSDILAFAVAVGRLPYPLSCPLVFKR